MRRTLVVAIAVALVLGVSTSAQAAGPDARSIIKAKTGAVATQVTAPQVTGKITIGTGKDRTGKALSSFTQRPTANSVRMMAAITNPSQTKVDFALMLPVGAGVVTQPDGSLTISREVTGPSTDGRSVDEQFGTIAVPWASDANGRALRTSYSYANGVLTQNIDTTGAAFPVVVDPWVTNGWFVYIHFSRTETFKLYNAWKLGTPTEVSALCGLLMLGGVPGVIAAAFCGVYVYRVIGDINVSVNYCVHNYNKRLVIKTFVPAPSTYAGSYCEYAP